jgi:hypothetical protein
MAHRFTATLTGRGPRGAWTFVPIPFDVEKAFGTAGRVPVSGTINGSAFANSLMPEGDGTHVMAVSKELQAAANARAGDEVEVVLDRDVTERNVAVPVELSDALRADDVARSTFEALAYSHRKQYAEWVGGAKKPETRAARARKAVEMVLAGTKRLR